MEKEKDFSTLKWLLFPLIVLALGVGIIINSVQVFDWSGSAAYILLVAVIFVISLVMVLHTGNKNNPKAKKAAFIFECAFMLALAATFICSIYVSRQMSGHRQAAAADVEKIKAIGSLKSAKAQATMAKNIKTESSISEAFAMAENLMFWPLVGETLLSLIGLMTVFGLTQFPSKSETLAGPDAQGGASFLPSGSASLSMSPQVASFTAANVSFQVKNKPQGGDSLGIRNNAIRWRQNGGNWKHVVYVTNADASVLESLTYNELADEAIARRTANAGRDGLCDLIEASKV